MKILLISYFFAPHNNIGALRMTKLAGFLVQRGHDVRVLTAANLPLATTLKQEIPSEQVTATRWLNLNALPELLFGGRKKIAQSGYSGAAKKGLIKRLGILYQTVLHYPDEMVGWVPYARRAGEALLRDWQPDVIYCTGKPFSSYRIASYLSRRAGVPWIAELRDLWTDNHDYAYPVWRRKREEQLEQRLLNSASALVTVSDLWAEQLRAKYKKPVAVVYNGFVPSDYPAETEITPSDPATLHLVYTGTFYPGFQDPTPLLEGLALLGEQAKAVQIDFYARYLDEIKTRAEQLGVAGSIRHSPLIAYREALRVQMQADALLLFLWGRGSETGKLGWFPAKLFEYLGARRPILAVGYERGLTADLIRAREAGIVTNQPEQIAAQLRAWLEQKRRDGKISFLPDAVGRGFSRDEQFETLEKFLDDLVTPFSTLPKSGEGVGELLRILLIGSQIATGGAQQVLLDQAAQFTQAGHSVTVAYFYDREGLYDTWQARYPFPIINLEAHRKGSGALVNGLRMLRGLWRLAKIMRVGNFDVAETFTQHANLLGLPVAALCGIPKRFASDHGLFYAFPGWQRRLHTGLVNSRLTTRLVSISAASAGLAREEGVRADKISVIPNGARFSQPAPDARARIRAGLGLTADQALILTVGRLTPEKDQATLLRAFESVRKAVPTAALAVVGDGPLRAALETQIQSLGLADSVHLAGFRQDVPDWLAACDVFVLSSESEGLPVVLIEAMAAARPIVSTRAGGIGEVLLDGDNGLLVDIGDAEALAQAVLSLLRNRQRAAGLAATARADYLERFTLERMCAAYLDLFRR